MSLSITCASGRYDKCTSVSLVTTPRSTAPANAENKLLCDSSTPLGIPVVPVIVFTAVVIAVVSADTCSDE
jgi:hypothetical protein